MAGALIPVWRMAAMEDGEPAPGALLYTWLSGTSTPQFVFSNLALSAAHTNPVVADAYGIFPIMYLAAVNYRLELRNASGSVIYTAQDNIQNLAQFFTQGVLGPASATNNAIVRWDGTDGTTVQNSGITIADAASGTLAGSNSGDVTLAGSLDYITIASQVITRGAIDLTTDTTGALGIASGGTGVTTGAIPIVQTTTATSNQNNFALSDGTFIHLRCTGAAPIFSGFATGSTGRMVLIECLGTTVTIYALNGSSSAANQIKTPSNGDIGVGANGWILLVYDPTTALWRANQLGAGEAGGILNLTAGIIRFPATQVPSTGVNDLDDYEEGTFTPTLGGSGGTSGQTYTVQAGFYLKIGKLVFVNGYLLISAKGTITTNAQLQGLPFTSGSDTNNISVLALQYNNMNTNFVTISARVEVNATAATLYGSAAAAANNVTVLTTADVTDNTGLRFGGCYRANA